MRSKIIILFIAAILISSYQLSAQKLPSKVDYIKLIHAQDSVIESMNDKILLLDIEIKKANQLLLPDSLSYDSMSGKINLIETRLEEATNPLLPDSLNFASFVVGFMAFVLSLFLAWATYISYLRLKDANDKIIETKENIKKADDSIDKFKTNSLKLFGKFEKDVTNKIQEFDEDREFVTNEIQNILKKFEDDIEKINAIEEDVSTQQTYLHQSLENVYELLLFIANTNVDRKLLKAIFIKRAISNIYSSDEKERFSSITTIGEIGEASEIRHLKYALLNELETDKNKLLANQSIVNINLRTNS